MTPCDRKHEDILDFEDGELDASRKGEVKRHLDECCDCKKLLRQIRAQRKALKHCASLKTRDTFFVLLQERIRRDLAGKRAPEYGAFFGPRRWVPVSAFALVLVVAAGWILTRKTAEVQAPLRVTSEAPASRVQASRKTPARVHYVIDDYRTSGASATASATASASASAPASAGSDTLVQMAAADTVSRVKDFDALRGRLTPVSF